MRQALAAVPVLLLALGGCLAVPTACPVTEAQHPLAAPGPSIIGRTDPAQPWDALVLRGGEPGAAEASVEPPTWGVETTTYATGALQRLRVTPSSSATSGANLTLAWSLDGPATACSGERGGVLAWGLHAPRPGKTVSAGMGVQVLTAGFWENGTLFYTNIAEVDASAWPRAGWYKYAGGAPLQVYVYERDRSEASPVWKAGTTGSAAGPMTGNATAWDYGTTIHGFNEALKGLSTNTVRVVRLSPEQAYTQSGTEGHRLYGSALVFYIKVVGVERLPCPEIALGCLPVGP